MTLSPYPTNPAKILTLLSWVSCYIFFQRIRRQQSDPCVCAKVSGIANVAKWWKEIKLKLEIDLNSIDTTELQVFLWITMKYNFRNPATVKSTVKDKIRRVVSTSTKINRVRLAHISLASTVTHLFYRGSRIETSGKHSKKV